MGYVGQSRGRSDSERMNDGRSVPLWPSAAAVVDGSRGVERARTTREDGLPAAPISRRRPSRTGSRSVDGRSRARGARPGDAVRPGPDGEPRRGDRSRVRRDRGDRREGQVADGCGRRTSTRASGSSARCRRWASTWASGSGRSARMGTVTVGEGADDACRRSHSRVDRSGPISVRTIRRQPLRRSRRTGSPS
ncbi:hypothetical protein HTG_18420 [Natrinema mahii]|nr:hypothetical protein HTG_18420 [Natrinema mahii]